MLVPVVRQLVFEALFFKRELPSQTRAFADLRHNADLCPRTQARADDLLRAVKRQRSVSYDVQGPADAGVDVVLILNDGLVQKYIGFQVKSDLEATKDVYDKIKSQYVDASEKYRDDLLDYYVLLCWNQQSREHAVRKVLSDFVGIERVRVVEPMYALGFLNLQPRDFDAILRACLGDSDPLLRAAKSVLASLTFTQASLLLRCLVNHVDGGPPLRLQDLIANRHIAAQYELALSLGLENDFRIAPSIIIPEEFKRERPYPSVSEVVAADLDVVSEQLVANEDFELVLSRDGLEAILALAYEGVARAEYRGHELLEYLETLLLPSGASDSARRDALSLALTSMMDGGVNDEAEDIAVLLQANFDRPSDAMRLLLPASLVADVEPIDETEAGFENVGQALIDLLSGYQSLEDAWNDL